MAGQNRHLRGETRIVLANVHGNVTIEAGDLVVINRDPGIVGQGAITTMLLEDGYAFPLTWVNAATAGSGWDHALATNFVGVAMENSASGTTENISIATAGTFRYPLYSISAVTVGAKISAVSPAGGSGSMAGTSRQTVINENTQSTIGSTAYLGTCVKTESGASFVDFEIRSAIYDGQLT